MTEPNAYDLVRFPTRPQSTTLPSAFAVHAHLRGRPFVPLSEARVLEIGCGDGTSLMSLATMAPGAQCFGFDLAHRPIEDGIALAKAARLDNVTLTAGDILDPDVVEGSFDFIIAHGVYAWVPEAVREELMALIGRHLSPNGIAYVSYNLSPGTNLRATLRTVMLDSVAGISDPRRRVDTALATLRMFANYWNGEDSAVSTALEVEVAELMRRQPAVLLHDDLGEIWEPQRLRDFAAHARAHGLNYLADSQPTVSSDEFFASTHFTSLREMGAGDRIRREELKDFTTQRQFRESLVMRWPVDGGLADWRRVLDLYGQAELRPVEASRYGYHAFRDSAGAQIETDNAELAHAISAMADAYPQAIPLAGVDQRVALGVLKLYTAGEVQLFTQPFRFTLTPGATPQVSALARAQATRGEVALATLRHTPLEIGDPAARHLIMMMDGGHTQPELAVAMAAYANSTWEQASERLPGAIRQLARAALFVA